MACQSSTGWDGRTRRPAAPSAPLNRLLVGWEESFPRPDGIGYFSKASSYSHTFANRANVWGTGRYVPIFEKAVSAKKTALFNQIDRRIDLLINLQLSSMIPMVNTK